MNHAVMPDEARAMPNASWSAVFAIAIGAFALVTTEVLPAIARDLGVGEGRAGRW